jgi:hypothetical protein
MCLYSYLIQIFTNVAGRERESFNASEFSSARLNPCHVGPTSSLPPEEASGRVKSYIGKCVVF